MFTRQKQVRQTHRKYSDSFELFVDSGVSCHKVRSTL